MQTATTTTPAAPSAHGSQSLYVGDLHPEVNEAMLFEVFNKIGAVESIRVIRDSTFKSLGYAYVNYHNSTDAEAALDQLNFHVIKDRPCRVMWSQRDPANRRSGVGNIFIKNLEASIDSKSLVDVFSEFGNIKSAKVVLDENMHSKGYGFVQFETQEQADRAMSALNGKLMNGQKVHIGPFVSKKDRLQQSQAQYTNVFIKNLAEDVTEQNLEEELLKGKYGVVQSKVVMRDQDGKSKGFGFINFDTHENAQRAVEELNNTEFHGKAIYVGRAMKKAERQALLREQYEQRKAERNSKYQGVNVYIKNLVPEVDDDTLRKEFARFGAINSTRVMKDDKGNSRLFGFVCFTTGEEAYAAVREMNGHMLQGKPLYVAIAQRKEDRRRELEMKFAQRHAQRPPMAPGMAPQMPYAMGYYGLGPQAPRYGMPYGMMMPQGGRQMNRWAPPMMMMPQAQVMPQAQAQAQPMPINNEKNALGEQLFPLVEKKQPKLAGKITGMLLELDAGEVRRLISEPAFLDGKIKEAMDVLEKSKMTPATRA